MPDEFWARQERKERRQRLIFWILLAGTIISGFIAVSFIYSGN